MRSRLLARIVKEAKRRGLTHAELALAARTSRSRVTAILGGNLKGVSTDLLLRIAGTLGLQPRLTLQRAA
jgi:transcriptional regulator with XRE-family HTH domain